MNNSRDANSLPIYSLFLTYFDSKSVSFHLNTLKRNNYIYKFYICSETMVFSNVVLQYCNN